MADVKLYLSNREERRRRVRRRVRITLTVILLALVAGGLVWLVRSPLLRVQEIRINGNKRISRDAVLAFLTDTVRRDSRIAGLLGADHMFAWPSHISEEELSVLPNAKHLEIRKSYTERTIYVDIEEREPFGIWCLRKNEPAACFWFEYDGTVFEPAPEAEGKLIRVVSDYTTDNLLIGAKVLPEHFLPNMREIVDALADSQLPVREVRYEDPALQEVHVLAYSGPAIYFSLRFSPQNTMAVVDSLIKKDQAGSLSPRFRDLQYIDFRVENRAYYK